MNRRRTITTEISTDSLEDVFDLMPGTTTKDIVVVDEQPTFKPSEYDEKDGEIDEQFQEVYNKALAAFEFQMERADSTDVDPKYVARMHEVAAGYLNTALAAAKEKAGLKSGKDKITAVMKKAASVTNNNTVIMTHSDAIKALRERQLEAKNLAADADAVEGEFGDI